MASAKPISKANRPRARQRTSDVRKSLTTRTNRRAGGRSNAIGLFAHARLSTVAGLTASRP